MITIGAAHSLLEGIISCDSISWISLSTLLYKPVEEYDLVEDEVEMYHWLEFYVLLTESCQVPTYARSNSCNSFSCSTDN